jgi:hypothetical protein
VVEKPEYPERTTDHGQATGKLYHMGLRETIIIDNYFNYYDIALRGLINPP